jgi:hypothetical protein
MTIDIPLATNPGTSGLPLTNPGETSETNSTSGANLLGGQGITETELTITENGSGRLDQNFSPMGEKPVLSNPFVDCPNISQAYPRLSKEIQDNIQRLKDSGVWEDYANLSKLDGDGLALLCMLFTQQSKAELIKGLKSILANKVEERMVAQNEYLADQKKVLDDQIEMQKAYEAQKKAAEEAAKTKSILGIIGAVFSAVVAVAVTVGTFGAAAPAAAALMVTAATLAVAASATSIAASACTLAILDNPELREELAPHITNLGIATTALGLASCACSVSGGLGGAGGALQGLAKAAKIGGQLASACCTIGSGVVDILQGIALSDLADKQKELDEKKIVLAKLDSEIEFLEKLIDTLSKSVEEFLELFLRTEQAAAEEMTRMSDSQLAIVDEIPRNA